MGQPQGVSGALQHMSCCVFRGKNVKSSVFQKTATLAVIATLSAGAAQAQVFTGSNTAADEADATQTAAREDINQTNRNDKFGTEGRRLGWYGSVAATANATSGNSDTFDIGAGANFGTFDGTNGHDFRLSLKYGETSGTTTASKLSLGYDYTRNLSGRTYAYGKLNTIYDEFGSYTKDTFVGFGLGYRVIDTDQTRWMLQAGPGYRVAEDSTGADFKETAVAASSKYFQSLSANAFLTNDTDILASDSDTVVTNDLGVSMRLTNSLAMRTSVQTTYHTDPTPGLKSTDNTFGVSLVYDFK